jgi:hypothetical protein
MQANDAATVSIDPIDEPRMSRERVRADDPEDARRYSRPEIFSVMVRVLCTARFRVVPAHPADLETLRQLDGVLLAYLRLACMRTSLDASVLHASSAHARKSSAYPGGWKLRHSFGQPYRQASTPTAAISRKLSLRSFVDAGTARPARPLRDLARAVGAAARAKKLGLWSRCPRTPYAPSRGIDTGRG